MEGGIARQGGGRDAATRQSGHGRPVWRVRLEREAQGTGPAIGNGWSGGVFRERFLVTFCRFKKSLAARARKPAFKIQLARRANIFRDWIPGRASGLPGMTGVPQGHHFSEDWRSTSGDCFALLAMTENSSVDARNNLTKQSLWTDTWNACSNQTSGKPERMPRALFAVGAHGHFLDLEADFVQSLCKLRRRAGRPDRQRSARA